VQKQKQKICNQLNMTTCNKHLSKHSSIKQTKYVPISNFWQLTKPSSFTF